MIRGAPGARLGPYELVSPLGTGGMGEVWKARDTRIDRTVAVKISPSQFDDRFEREARAIGALNHANICTLFDIGPNYLVLEYVDGEPVGHAEDLRKLLDQATQIAAGLAAAHESGIVHRDLKPANILVSRDGRVKILDFGLAKHVAPPLGDATVAMTSTQPGMVLGTVAYMSPEQARGAPLDSRSDQFSFGLVLYEMITGKRAFPRPTAAETLAAILREDPAPLPASVPAPLRWIVERCLEKDPQDRYSSTEDLHRDLRQLRQHLSESLLPAAGEVPAVSGSRRARSWLPAAAAAILLIAAGVAFEAGRMSGRFHLDLRFSPVANEPETETRPAFSPDGKTVAYVRSEAPESQIMIRELNAAMPALVAPAPKDAGSLAWSADGTRIYFLTAGPAPELWFVSVSGGAPQRVLTGMGPAFGLTPDGTVLLTTGEAAEAQGGPQTRLLASSPPGAPLKPLPGISLPAENSGARGVLAFSPDGARFVIPCGGRGEPRICMVQYPAGRVRMIPTPQPVRSVSWFPDSRHILTVDRSSMRIVDTETGEETPVLNTPDVLQGATLSPTGQSVVYSTGTADYDIEEMSIDGKDLRPLISSSLPETSPHWSPDGRSLVYVRSYVNESEIWIRTGDGHAMRLAQSMEGAFSLRSPRFSPDGRRVAYASAGSLFIVLAGGGRPVAVFQEPGATVLGEDWSPDGSQLVLAVRPASGTSRLVRIPSDGGQPVVVAKGIPGSPLVNPEWSSDGRWIAYSGADGLHLVAPEGTSDHLLAASVMAGDFSRDGKRYYALRQDVRRDWTLTALDVSTGHAGDPIPLPIPKDKYVGSMTLHPDGKHMALHLHELRYDLWMIQGFPQPERGWRRLFREWMNP